MSYPDFSNYTLETFNQTLLGDTDLCTLQTCPLILDGYLLGEMTYIPNLGGNVFYTLAFASVVLAQLYQGIKYRTWSFLIGLIGGGILEVIGYAARIVIHHNPFSSDGFIAYLCCLTIGPAFLTASIYVCLKRLINIYTPAAARLKPNYYTYIFISCDVISLVLQAVGGALASTSDTIEEEHVGVHVMVAGLACQVVSLAVFGYLCIDLFINIRRLQNSAEAPMETPIRKVEPKTAQESSTDRSSESFRTGPFNPQFEDIRQSPSHHHFVLGLSAAAVLIFIRSIYRCAELSGGFNGSLANDEVAFMILEGCLILLAVLCLTLWHPGRVWGKNGWKTAGLSRPLQQGD